MIQIKSDFPEVALRMSEAAARLAADLPVLMERAAVEVEAVATLAITHATPRGDTGDLAASTTGDIAPAGFGALITIRQPAVSKPNWDGSGGNIPYAQFVIAGRGAIVAPSTGPYSTGKQALRTPWGPRRRVGPARAQPYPTEALAAAEVPMAAAISAAADAMLDALGESL